MNKYPYYKTKDFRSVYFYQLDPSGNRTMAVSHLASYHKTLVSININRIFALLSFLLFDKYGIN
jgi:hypothetical protein